MKEEDCDCDAGYEWKVGFGLVEEDKICRKCNGTRKLISARKE